jgi:hypothetical protein
MPFLMIITLIIKHLNNYLLLITIQRNIFFFFKFK